MTLQILFLGANPRDTTRIRIDEELREIDKQLRLSAGRDRLLLGQKWAVRPDDLQQSLVDTEPQIVHFSGHGSTTGICLEDEQGNSKEVNAEALSDLFALFKGTVKCVVLNACYSEAQAVAINLHVPYVIGMSDAMPDDAATHFSVGFYKAIAAGKTVEFAFNLGVNAIKLEGLAFDKLPKLLKTSDNLVLLQPLAAAITQPNVELIDAKTVKRKWWIYGGIAAVAAAVVGYIFGGNKPVTSLEYRISNASMDIYEGSSDSFKLTFDVIADNNTLKTCELVRDSFSLQMPNSDATSKPLHEGRGHISVKRNENVSTNVAFLIPWMTRSGNLTLNIGRPNGAVHIDYLYGAPIASTDLAEDKGDKKGKENVENPPTNPPTNSGIEVQPSRDIEPSSPAKIESTDDKPSKTQSNRKPIKITKRRPNAAINKKDSVKTTSIVSRPIPPQPKPIEVRKPIDPKPTETKPLPEPPTATVVIPTEIPNGNNTRMNGGTIKCNPKILQQMKRLAPEKTRYSK